MRFFLGLLSVMLLNIGAAQADSFFNSDGLLHAKEIKLADASSAKNSATLRIMTYVDQRVEPDARLLGAFNTRIGGLSGKQLRLDRDVSVIATDQIKQQFSNAGFAVLAEDAAATFELTGVVKTLTLDSKARDEITIVLETTLSEIATHKVIWTAVVSQKESRFAGVTGNNRDDIVDFLYRELGVVSGKTVSAVNSLLMASYPALFNLTPGTKTIDGVTVLSSPTTASSGVASNNPAWVAPNQSAGVTTGVVRVSTQPSRAKIYVDGIYYGMSPQRLELEAGVHTLIAKLRAYKTESEKILVRKDEATELELSFSK
jgi:PEGA domain